MTSIVFPKGSKALAKRYLSQNILNQLQGKKTPKGFTLAKAVASGIKNPDSAIGLYAGDAQSYRVFSSLFDPVIKDYHRGSTHKGIPGDMKPIELPDPDPEKKFIISSRIRVARNLEGFSFPCHITLKQRREAEKQIICALALLNDDLKGTYVSFEDITQEKQNELEAGNLIFKKGDRFQEAAGINSDFPKCRGVFHSFDKKLIIWANEEDHMRIISMEKNSDLGSVFKRLTRALKILSNSLDFAWNQNSGFLASCPTNIGTAMRAGVHIRLKKLEQNKHHLTNLAEQYNLQVRGTRGEKTKVENSVFDISNIQRLGVSEHDILNTLHKGITAIITTEKELL